jgi:hypothetical protein
MVWTPRQGLCLFRSEYPCLGPYFANERVALTQQSVTVISDQQGSPNQASTPRRPRFAHFFPEKIHWRYGSGREMAEQVNLEQ